MKRATSVALLITAAIVAGQAPASAAPAAWMLNGKTLTEEGLTSAPAKTTAKTDENGVLSGGGLTITCTGNGEATSPAIHEKDLSTANSLILTACTASPSPCTVPSTIGTVPLSLEGTLDGASATKGVIKPASGSVLTTLKVGGEEAGCAAAGNKPIRGDIEILSPTGQEERTDQLERVNQATSTLLLLGSSSASLKGGVLVLLANSQSWSFL